MCGLLLSIPSPFHILSLTLSIVPYKATIVDVVVVVVVQATVAVVIFSQADTEVLGMGGGEDYERKKNV